MRRSVTILALLLIAAACAVVQPPSGGPEDKTPPYMVGTSPAGDSSGVGRDTKIVLTFTEKVDIESFKKRITLYPPVEFEKIDARDNRVEISFREMLPETTICVLLKSGFKDDHLVVNKDNHIFCFSTGEKMQRGAISGKILFKQKPDSTGVVMLVQVDSDTTADITRVQESRIAFTDNFGNYSLNALPAEGSRFILWSFIDKDEDGRFSAGKEFHVIYPDTIVLSAQRERIAGIDMNIIDPDEPGSIEGKVEYEDVTGKAPMVRFDCLLEERKPYVTSADSTGFFSIEKVLPGDYIFSAFMDFTPDSVPGYYTDPADTANLIPEPVFVHPDTLKLLPAEKKVLPPVRIEGNDGQE